MNRYIFIIILFVVQLVNSQTLIGKIVGISDGDTVKLLVKDSLLHRVRVANIDCPERKQPFSAKAKQFTSDAVFGKTVKVETITTDRYGRLVGLVIYNDSLNLSRELVKHGFAWHYVRYSNDMELEFMEASARKNKIGLWKDEHPIAPWEWRANKKKK